MSFTVGTAAYARHVGRYGAALSAVHADAARLLPGDRALDVGCGPGVLLDELARRLGIERVAGVDPSEPFVAAARAAVPGADVRPAPAERLPFDTDAFDVVLSQLVVNFMADVEAGVGEMRRVARRAVTSCVWDYAGEMTMLRAFWDAALELDADAPDEGRTMRYCTPEELSELWTRAGLREVETQPLLVEARYENFDDYWLPFTAGIAPSGAYCASLAEEQQTALKEACFRRLGSPSGSFSLSARAWFVTGSTP
ncbi:MAG TPA: methyltransferase domain-containing protein [Gaiellaceae bacterium]|nr:methyltransferase domain-containing protein [Gaiellaceae bacterium]